MQLFFAAVALVTIEMIDTALSTRACYFCADFKSNCDRDARSHKPLKMNCENFLVNGDRVNKHIHHPIQFTQQSEVHIFWSGLAKRNAKTRCIDITYKYNRAYAELLEKYYNFTKDLTYGFRSCVYNDFVLYKDACEQFHDKLDLKQKFVKEFECRICARQFCNADVKISPQFGYHFSVASSVWSLVFLKLFNYGHNL